MNRMAEAWCRSPSDCGPSAAPRRTRVRGCALAFAALTATAAIATAARPQPPLLLWNASASSPVGLYAVLRSDSVRVGDTVVAWPPASARRLAARRRYLPASVPLVKRVAAVAGARVCARGSRILVNDTVAALRRARDAAGRPLPWWTGCRTLEAHQLLLLSEHRPDAFDGRYFGITQAREVVGRARLLWRA